MATCLYLGRVDHVRLKPRHHAFRYRIAMLYLDLDTMDRDLGRFPWLLGKAISPLRFRRSDHLGEPGEPMTAAVRRFVAEQTGISPVGPIRLLTGFGFMAWRFNPVSFYYCFNADDSGVDFVVAEVTNTPWRERHYYVLDFRDASEHPAGDQSVARPGAVRAVQPLSASHDKQFHVSPFMPMDTRYLWQVAVPADHLHLAITVERNDEAIFSAGLELERRDFGRGQLWRIFAFTPFTSVKVVAAIHWQALRLWLKGARFFPHPGTSPTRAADSSPASGDRS